MISVLLSGDMYAVSKFGITFHDWYASGLHSYNTASGMLAIMQWYIAYNVYNNET